MKPMKSDYDRRKISDYHLKNDNKKNNQKAIKKYLIIIIIINQTDDRNAAFVSNQTIFMNQVMVNIKVQINIAHIHFIY